MSSITTTIAKALVIPAALVLPLTACAVEPTTTPPAAATVASGTALAAKTYTMATVKKHHTRTSCWTVVGKGVYNLTGWVSKHPGGSKRIVAMCGKNATAAFRAQHGSTGRAAKVLASYKIGKLA